MSKWFFSLQFRLILLFVLVLALALGGVSFYVGYAAKREIEHFRQDFEAARTERITYTLDQYYSEHGGWAGLQSFIEQAGLVSGQRIVLLDPEGKMVADSHERFGRPWRRPQMGTQDFPILMGGAEIGSVALANSDEGGLPADPPWSRLVSAVNNWLLWTGLAAGGGGILLVSLLSRQVLWPVRTLTSAARRLGQGDFSQRVSASGRDEVGELGRTFNSMAEGLETAEQQRRTLMADVAHELRTPLSNIQGYVEAVRDGLIHTDNAALDSIHYQVLHLVHLVEDVRLLALAESGALRLSIEPDSLSDVLQRSVDSFRPQAESKEISISLGMKPGFPLVKMDRTRVAQVIDNLLQNAVHHTPEGGHVRVSAEVVGTTNARVTVADTGKGIPPEDLPHIFDRFYRVDSSRTRATGGVGLGLTIAKQLVEAQGGTIRAESTPGEGSQLVFDLPLAETTNTIDG